MKWTTKQDAYLEAHAHKGAEWCAREMAREFGVRRSAESVRRHAYRIGASMRIHEVCPICGRDVPRLKDGSGLCRACHMRERSARTRELRDGLERTFQEQQDEREYERNRKWLQRHYEEIVKLSRNMSLRRSEG